MAMTDTLSPERLAEIQELRDKAAIKSDNAPDEIKRVQAVFDLGESAPALLDHITAQADEIERLRKENFGLAAGQCVGMVGDEYGNPVCPHTAQLTRYRTVVEECAAPLPFCPLGKSQLQREVELANEFDRRQKLALAALEDGDV